MPIAMLLLLQPMKAADEALERYAAWAKINPAYVATGSVGTAGSKEEVAIEYRIQRPGAIWFQAKSGSLIYRMAKTAAGQVETESGQGVYDEVPVGPGMVVQNSKISGLQLYACPMWLTQTDLKPMFTGPLKSEKAVIEGHNVDVVHSKVENMEGSRELWIWLKKSGEPARFRMKTTGMQGGSDRTWKFKQFGPLGPDPFRLDIPNTYVPHRLPDLASPMPMGSRVKLGSWQLNGQTVDLDAQAKGTVLIAALTPGTAPSKRIETSLATLEKGGLKVLRLAEGKGGPNLYSDPTGKRFDALAIPATPYLMLLKEGKIAGMWMGADSTDTALIEDVRSVASGS